MNKLLACLSIYVLLFAQAHTADAQIILKHKAGGGGGTAVTIDTSGGWNNTGGGGTSSPHTFPNITIGAHSNKALIVGCTPNSDTDTVTDMKWNTTEQMTFAGKVELAGSGKAISVWQIVNPTATTAAVKLSWSSGSDAPGCVYYSLYNVNQTTPIHNLVGEAPGFFPSDSDSPVSVSSATNELAVFIFNAGSVADLAAAAPASATVEGNNGFNGFNIYGTTTAGAATSTVHMSGTGLTGRVQIDVKFSVMTP